MKVNAAIRKIRAEAFEFESQLKGIIERNPAYAQLSITDIFRPFHEGEYLINLVNEQHFIKGRPTFTTPPMLRLYAIKLPEDVILITGGAIKLTKQNNRAHLIHETAQLRRVNAFMKENQINYIEDFFNQ
jgi:hypothetical protein